MKKFLCLILATILCVALFSGCSEIDVNDVSQDVADEYNDESTKQTTENSDNITKSKLEKLELAENPLEELFDNKYVYQGNLFVNHAKRGNKSMDEFHGTLIKLKENNDVFIWTEFDGRPAITWGKGDAFLSFSSNDDGNSAPTNPVFTKIDSSSCDTFKYDVYRYDAIIDPDYNQYVVYVDYGCTENMVQIKVDFWWESWPELNGNDMFDEKMKLVMSELAPMIEINCSCCTA